MTSSGRPHRALEPMKRSREIVGDVSAGTRISTSSGAVYVSSGDVELHENLCALQKCDFARPPDPREKQATAAHDDATAGDAAMAGVIHPASGYPTWNASSGTRRRVTSAATSSRRSAATSASRAR